MAEKNENTERNEKEEKFQAKLKELLALAKKKKNVLEYQEISDFFQDMELNAEQFEKILRRIFTKRRRRYYLNSITVMAK